jgi:hypothetical protein
MSTTLHCDNCDWSVTSEDEQDRVEYAIYHALGVSHSVSEGNLLDRYDELDAGSGGEA